MYMQVVHVYTGIYIHIIIYTGRYLYCRWRLHYQERIAIPVNFIGGGNQNTREKKLQKESNLLTTLVKKIGK
jgi:hypothetical protein